MAINKIDHPQGVERAGSFPQRKPELVPVNQGDPAQRSRRWV